MHRGNLFTDLPPASTEEHFEALCRGDTARVERIVSTGQATPPGEWYDQAQAEWVVLLQGSAGLIFEGDQQAVVLAPGDWVLIPARCRHRVAWTHPEQPTIWLAVHLDADPTA